MRQFEVTEHGVELEDMIGDLFAEQSFDPSTRVSYIVGQHVVLFAVDVRRLVVDLKIEKGYMEKFPCIKPHK